MTTLRLKCICGRNLLDVTWVRRDPAHPQGWVRVERRPNVHWRPDRNAASVAGSEWTHNVRCRCGENWALAEAKLAQWYGAAHEQSSGVVYAVLGADV